MRKLSVSGEKGSRHSHTHYLNPMARQSNLIVAMSIPDDHPSSRPQTVEGKETISRDYSAYLQDESRLAGGQAEALFFPRTEGELAAAIRTCAATGCSATFSAARTGISGGAVPPGGALISLERMHGILGIGYDPQEKAWYLSCLPGTSLTEINDLLLQGKMTGLQDLEGQALERFQQERPRLYYPVDPTETNASLGGTVATNASGARSFRYGPTRNWVRRLRVVLANGMLLNIQRGQCRAAPTGFVIRCGERHLHLPLPGYRMPEVKNAAGFFSRDGMDLIDLFIGSEGLLGVFSLVEIRLTERPRDFSILLFFATAGEAFRFVAAARSDPDLKPEFLEYIDAHGLDLLRRTQSEDPLPLGVPPLPGQARAAVFCNLSLNDSSLEQGIRRLQPLLETNGGSMEHSWGALESREQERLRLLRHALPETVNSIISRRQAQFPGLHKLGTDLAVGNEDFLELEAFCRTSLEQAGLEYVAFGHIGDNHLHFNILPRNEQELEQARDLYRTLADKALSLSGTISAEHGIGKLKRDYLPAMYGEAGIAGMRRVKQVLDPGGLFNPGNMFVLGSQ